MTTPDAPIPESTSLWLSRATAAHGARSSTGVDPAHPEPFEPDAVYDAVVVGAGITGLTTALLLARSGVTVAVLEARHVGAVTTGHTTGKVSLLQGTVLSSLKRKAGADVVQAYVEANREGQAWLTRYLDEHEVAYQRRPAYTYATTPSGLEILEPELHAAREVGLDVHYTEDVGLPYATAGALRLDGQAQIDPLPVLVALAADLRAHGGVLVEGVRVRDVDAPRVAGERVTLTTSLGRVQADQVVLATGTPILNRGLDFARLEPLRSNAAAYRLPGSAPLPQGMYLSVDQPGRTLRTAPDPQGGEALVVGGNGYPVGRRGSPAALVAELDEWVRQQFPGAERTHRWSAQDYRATGLAPIVGALPGSGRRIHVATGFNKWGLTNGVAAALSLASHILDGRSDWADTLYDHAPTLGGIADALKINAKVAAHLASGWVSAETSRSEDSEAEESRSDGAAVPPADPAETPADRPAASRRGAAAGTLPEEGQGLVHRQGVAPVAVAKVGGRVCRVSAVCTHLGGVLNWNDAERTWDCPLHGSRFEASGRRIEGPAVRDLPTAERSPRPE